MTAIVREVHPSMCKHQPVGTQHRIEVDGETFTVHSRGTGTYDYRWISGPHPNYGFTSASCPPVALDDEAHRGAIEDFLAEIDPVTGYLRED
jgi:hypothetical protein